MDNDNVCVYMHTHITAMTPDVVLYYSISTSILQYFGNGISAYSPPPLEETNGRQTITIPPFLTCYFPPFSSSVVCQVRAGDLAGAESALDSAVHYWENRMDDDTPPTPPPPCPPCAAPSPLEIMVLQSAEFKHGQGKEEEAVGLYERVSGSKNAKRRAEGVNGTLACMVATDLGEKGGSGDVSLVSTHDSYY